MCFRECFFMNVFPIGLQYDLNYIRKFWSCCYLSFHCFSIKLKTRCSIVSCKTRNHPKTSPATHKPAKLSTNCRQISQTIHKPSKNHLPTSQITHKPTKYWTNHPKTSQLWAENQFFMLPKNFSNNAKHVLNLQPLYSISSTFSSEDLSQVGIEGKWRGLFKR